MTRRATIVRRGHLVVISAMHVQYYVTITAGWPATPMPKQKIDFNTVRQMALALPNVEDGTAYGSPAVKVKGALLACIAIHKSAEPGSLAVRIDFASRDELLQAQPETYYLTPHYVDYPVVLVRLSRIHRDALRDLLRASWRFVSARRRPRKPR